MLLGTRPIQLAGSWYGRLMLLIGSWYDTELLRTRSLQLIESEYGAAWYASYEVNTAGT